MGFLIELTIVRPRSVRVAHDRRMDDHAHEEALARGILDEAEAQTGVRWQLEGRFPRGTRGAWRIRGPEGPAVLKFDLRGDVGRDVLLRSRRVTNLLQRAGAPVPAYLAIGEPSDTQWSIIECMPGSDAAMTPRIAEQMTQLTDRQRNLGVLLPPDARDWNAHIEDELFGSRPMSEKVAAASPEGAALVEQVDAAVAALRGAMPGAHDIVHGDYQHYNALEDAAGNVTAVLDWDGAGRGDRGIDIARLRMDASLQAIEGDGADAAMVSRLGDAVVRTSGEAGLALFTAYYAVQVAEFAQRAIPDRAHEYIATVSDSLAQVTRGLAQRTASHRVAAELG